MSDINEQTENWRGKEYSFYSHIKCEAFPCHEISNIENFNCLFCYCPLYALGKNCKGNYTYLPSGVKNCTNCSYPHEKENYGNIINRFEDIKKVMSL